MRVSFISHLFRQPLQQEETTAEFLSRDTDATFFFNLKWKIRQEKPVLCLKDNESFVISQPSAMHNLAAEFYSQLYAADESVLGSSKNTQSWKICTPNICSRRGSVIPGESSDWLMAPQEHTQSSSSILVTILSCNIKGSRRSHTFKGPPELVIGKISAVF